MSTRPDDLDRDEREALKGLEDQLDALRERHRDDPPIDLLRAAHGDVLPAELQETLRRYLADNEWSRTLVDGLDHDEPVLDPQAERRLLARIDGEAARARDTEGFRTWFRIALVASGVAVSALVIWFAVWGPDSTIRPASGGASSVAVQPPPTPPFQLAFDKPDVRLSMAALTWRGAPGDDNPLLADLKPAFDAYRASDYEAAERELTALSSRYPNAVEVHFYQGVSRLFLNEPAMAIASFAAAENVADSTFLADVRWFRAVAEQRAGNLTDARARLDALCQSGDAARACAALEQLDAATPTP